MPATITKPTAVTASTPAPSKAEAVAITPVAAGNAGILMHRLRKFYEEYMYRRGSDMSFNDMRRAGYLSEELSTRECGEAVAILARAFADAVGEAVAE